MDKETLKTIKEKLLRKKETLENELHVFAKRNKNIKDDFKTIFPDFGDKDDENAAEVAAYSDNLSFEQNLEVTLRDVNKALERIEKGEYGICHYCGKVIDKERLLIRPESSACVECKKKLKGE